MELLFWGGMQSSFFDAGLRALAAAGHRVSVVFGSPSKWVPPVAEKDIEHYDYLAEAYVWSDQAVRTSLSRLRSGRPDVLVVTTWTALPYLYGAARAPKTTIRLVAGDNPWVGSMKQRVGLVTHRYVLKACFDGAWVPGAPQKKLMSLLGFDATEIIEGLNCCDTDLFANPPRPEDRADAPFLFVGRLVENKGVRQLVDAFRQFRQATGSSRRLRIVGSGDVEVAGDGIEVISHVDPSTVRQLMGESYALVHPAFHEPWGVVIHEAVCMGLPLILSRNVYAGTRFFRPGSNGVFVEPEVPDLVRALREFDQLSPARYQEMSEASRQLGSQVTLESYVDTFEQGVARLRRSRSLAGAV